MTTKRFQMSRKKISIIAAVLVVILAVALFVFKPWLLFIDKKVEDQLPAALSSQSSTQTTPSSGDAMERTDKMMAENAAQHRQGTFISHEHQTSGKVDLIVDSDGKKKLVLSNLSTSNGPDVHVWLSKGPVVEGQAGWFVAKDHEHFDVAPIKGNQGNQVYTLPDNINFSDWKSVTLWCEAFNVSFGAAELS